MIGKRKRAYVPKIRGCYECSQRRVHCDRTEPSCSKCSAKGILCSGLGVRYRFIGDVVKRGSSKKWEKKTTTPVAHPENRIREEEEEKFYSNNRSMRKSPLEHAAIVSSATLRTLDPEKQYLLLYFSQHIAPELVAIDDQHNGWRCLVLPIAHTDDLIMDAVLSAATFHFSTNVSSSPFDPTMIYHKAIRKLSQRQDLLAYNTTGQQTILLALLILLATTMVNGSSDFRRLFYLFEAAQNVIGGEHIIIRGNLGLFLVRQYLKYRGYAAFQLSQTEGIDHLRQTAEIRPSRSRGWEDFRSCLEYNPSYEKWMLLVYDMIEQACNIYVTRASLGTDGPALIEQVETLMTTMQPFPWGVPVEHTLVWPLFIAAAESSMPEQQNYFGDQLLKLYRRNGFANILSAMQFLKEQWTGQHTRDWTKLLPELPFFIV